MRSSASGTPHPRRNASGIFPRERTSVSTPTVLGPSCLIDSRPFTSERSTSPKTVPLHACTAEVGPAEVGPAEVGTAEVGPAEVGPAEVGPAEVGPAEVGPEVGPRRSAALRWAPRRSAPPRSAPPRSGISSACSRRRFHSRIPSRPAPEQSDGLVAVHVVAPPLGRPKQDPRAGALLPGGDPGPGTGPGRFGESVAW